MTSSPDAHETSLPVFPLCRGRGSRQPPGPRDFYEEVRAVEEFEENKWSVFELDNEKGYRLIRFDSNIGKILSEAKFGVTNLDLNRI